MNNEYSDSTYEKASIFNFYINKMIILSAKYYYKKKMNRDYHESNTDVFNFAKDEENIEEGLIDFNDFELKENNFINECDNEELLQAITRLSAIEQAVVFLCFSKELKRSEAAKILNVCEDTISRAKLRAIKKLKRYLKGAEDNE